MKQMPQNTAGQPVPKQRPPRTSRRPLDTRSVSPSACLLASEKIQALHLGLIGHEGGTWPPGEHSSGFHAGDRRGDHTRLPWNGTHTFYLVLLGVHSVIITKIPPAL